MSRIAAKEVSTPSDQKPSASIRGIALDLAMVARPSGRDPHSESTEEAQVHDKPAGPGAPRDRTNEWVERQLASAPPLTEERWKGIARIIHRQITFARDESNAPPFRDA